MRGKKRAAGTLALDRPLRSEAPGGGKRTAVTCEFVNEGDEALVVSWVRSDGVLVHERSLAGGSRHCELTYDGDAFVVYRSGCAPKCWYRPQERGRHRVVLGGPEGVRAEHSCAEEESKDAITYESELAAGFVVDFDDRLCRRRTSSGKHSSSIDFDFDFQEASAAREAFRKDVRAARAKLPREIADFLRETTRFVVNKETRSDLRGCCYHGVDGGAWLESNGLPRRFAGCVQVYCLDEYRRDAALWGPGGCLLHELAHAYHDKCLFLGHKNPTVRDRYLKARQRYANVQVKPDFRRERHYACVNEMEFFAELSVAFLETDAAVLYNKWEPHNRHQLQRFDPETSALLERAWLNRDPLQDHPHPLPGGGRDFFPSSSSSSPRHNGPNRHTPRSSCVPSWLTPPVGLAAACWRDKATTGRGPVVKVWTLVSPCLLLRHLFLRWLRPLAPAPKAASPS
mmetsp:Transcript_9586/g.31298  ORF Transcript_9586/g.31298 Transcript_9586/m.31298 type:complete len:456 (-) Transcript_9586:68-1435(-)